MQRALTSGVSGMLNNQLVLDVTANNLANINTQGFKSSRVSFSTALIQSEFTGSAPGSSIGGQNPRQVGLGMQTAAISLDMRQGSLQTTGRNLDLAIQGDGFFEVTDGTRPSYSRVGNFGFDSNDNLVDIGTGYKLIGNTYNLATNPDGSQSILGINTPLNIPRAEAFPPRRTEAIQLQGNLSSAAGALRGASLQAIFPMVESNTNRAATEDTPLANLSLFKGGPRPAAPADEITMHVFGTKPNGETYAGSFQIRPWDTPTVANGKSGSVGDLISKMNNVLVQGNERFGTMRLDNGNLIVSSVGNGQGFSLFFGEQDPLGTTLNQPGLAGAFNFTGTTTTVDSHTVLAADVGMLNPTFTMPAVDYTAQGTAALRVSVKVNGIERGSIAIPAADYTTATPTFSLASLPHVATGDVITYDVSGTLNLGASNLSWATIYAPDSAPANLTADVDADGLPDMFEENSATDVNAWVYENETNSTFNWYRARFAPETVTSAIEVFDSQGGRHTVESRFIRTGTRTDPATNARINSWDLIVGTTPGEGVIVDDLVCGIEFDQEGRYTGALGTTLHGTSMNDTDYVGNPANGTIQIDWATTGPTDPAVMRMDLGAANTFKGLTSFGSDSTAAALNQDGYTDGKLDSLSVSTEGDITGLYTNGVSRKLAQLTLATFRNPAGLSQEGNNLFRESVNSGSPTRRIAGQGAGFITAGALEGGNVDIATEFTRIITAQRGFQVSARVIQTTDEILEELANLVR
ncbi:MAG: flagellar hook-basal body complex protein [Planctomycetes bacterium]|nr:flagellar hook-basal body complex protein [Planctomycetota bacterium]